MKLLCLGSPHSNLWRISEPAPGVDDLTATKLRQVGDPAETLEFRLVVWFPRCVSGRPRSRIRWRAGGPTAIVVFHIVPHDDLEVLSLCLLHQPCRGITLGDPVVLQLLVGCAECIATGLYRFTERESRLESIDDMVHHPLVMLQTGE